MTKQKPQSEQQENAQEKTAQAPKTFDDLKAIAESYGLKIPLEAPFTPNDLNKVSILFRLPIDEDAIQVSKSIDTRRGYDTTGYSYQSHIDRINFVLGPTNWTWEILNEDYEEGTTSSNKVKHTYSGEIRLSIGYREFNEASGKWDWIEVHSVPPIPTDHESLEKGSARKGMLTKGLKRATSFLGIGADAYLGVLDDDMMTGAGPEDDMTTPRYKAGVPWEDQQIVEKEFGTLLSFGKKKGFSTPERLREFYKTASNGGIDKAPATLTKGELKRVNSLLAKLPDAKDKTPTEPADTRETTTDDKASNHPDNVPETMQRPTTMAELLSADDETIRELAAEFSMTLPSDLSKSKAGLCKALANLMKLQ